MIGKTFAFFFFAMAFVLLFATIAPFFHMDVLPAIHSSSRSFSAFLMALFIGLYIRSTSRSSSR